MSIIDGTLKVLDTLDNVTDSILDMHIGDGKYGLYGKLNWLLRRSLGLRYKSYGFMLENVTRNAGNGYFTYDGFGTPIGEMSNPYYNTFFMPARFITDPVRRMTSNYIEHFKSVYGENLSVENINYTHNFTIKGEASKVGSIDLSNVKDSLISPTYSAYDAIIRKNNNAVTNPNSLETDTELGWVNGFHMVNTLRNAIVQNDEHKSYEYSITEKLGKAFGMNTEAVTDGNILDISYRRSFDNGRFEDLSPFDEEASPVYNSNYGRYEDLGVYKDYYKSTPSKTTRKFIFDSVRKNRYRPTIEDGDKAVTYLDTMLKSRDEGGVGHVDSFIDGNSIRYIFNTLSTHSNIAGEGILNTYGEREGKSAHNIMSKTANRGIRFGITNTFSNTLTSNDLLKKTNDAFKEGKLGTLISRFESGPNAISENDIKETAYTKGHGLSHGRNLLKTVATKENGYNNPYCRVWTHHHQYNRLKDAIRPFSESDDTIITQGELYSNYNFSSFSASARDNFGNGRQRLDEYGVLNHKNGLVNITPIDGPTENKVDIRNCMFSIENLAWRGVSDMNNSEYRVGGLSPEQKGPNGGRIMWFPPYDINFNEQTSTQWNETEFVGRGESIYTYRNTRRTGTLNFKLLIDHPSIIDYWEGRKKISKVNGIVGDDDLNDPEQQILRFFAGCEMLKANPQQNIPRVSKENPPAVDEPAPTPKTRVVSFFVFYPNDYSGMDDDPTSAITYLINGLGSGYEYNESTKRNNQITPTLTTYYSNGKKVGGYEVRTTTGISLRRTPCDAMVKSFATAQTANGKKIKLALQVGPEKKPWWKCKWYYRCDKNKVDEELYKHESYVDSASFGLNSLYSDTAKNTILDNNQDIEEKNLFSLTDVFVALTKGNSSSLLGGHFSPKNVKDFTDIISSGNIEKIVCNGFASLDGGTKKQSENSKRNNELAKYRAKTVKDWLKNKMGVKAKKWEVLSQTYAPFRGVTDVSSLRRKYERRARIDIYIKVEDSKLDVNALSSGSQPSSGLGKTYLTSQTNASYAYAGENYITNYIDALSNERFESDGLTNSKNAQKRSENVRFALDNTPSLSMNVRNNIHNGNVGNSADGSSYTMGDNILKNNLSDGFTESKTNFDADGGVLGVTNTVDNNTTGPERYDNEAKFFELLEINEPVLHHKITEKIKYFDPAFHSMTPEGFNARLTFLQQCMRQGPTISSSDNGEVTANNLSFGRPPVCVLRIGDFFHTKIVINSLDIQYDPLVWDLNTEGIGVMPMIAQVSIGFNFIGGSSLSGPISRLQNALSFNMYANTEVYDNRSELVEYDPSDGQTIKNYHPYYPNIEN